MPNIIAVRAGHSSRILATRQTNDLPLLFETAHVRSISFTLNLVGYPNNPPCGDALLSGNELNSFDSDFICRCASICLITTGSSILAIILIAPPHVSHVKVPLNRLITRVRVGSVLAAEALNLSDRYGSILLKNS